MVRTFVSFLLLACGCEPLRALEADTIAGTILDRHGKPVAGALVIVSDAASGIPVGPDFQPFAHGMELREIVSAVSDSRGEFSIPDVKPGTYRVLAQSWGNGDKPVTKPLDVNGPIVRLRGLVERVVVPSEEARHVAMRPCGTATLDVTADPLPGNDETLLVVSRQPLVADPILGFAAWSGGFMPGMVAANRMPKGRTTFYDLPEGSVYLAAFAADNSPGFGGAACQLKATRAVASVVPLIAGWSDGHKTPPPELVDLVAKVQSFSRDEFRTLVEQQYPDLAKWMHPGEAQARNAWSGMIPYLDKRVNLPDGTSVPLKDLMAAESYRRLADHDRARRKE